MKIAFAIIGLIICIALGYVFSLKYTNRKNFYQSFQSFNNNLKNEVKFSQNSILHIVNNFELNSDFNKKTKEILISKKNLKIPYLSKDENQFYLTYLNSIGKTDKLSQAEYLEISGQNISENLKNAQELEKKYKPLCLKLGFCLGLIILILLL